jgi:hypothetical protein
VRKKRHVGRAAVPRRDVPPPPPRPAGSAKVGQAVGKAVPLERAHTEVIGPAGTQSQPVFVDPSGARRRRLSRLAYVLGVLLIVILALVWWIQLSGHSSPPGGTPCSTSTSAGCAR